MKITPCPLKGLLLIEPVVFGDARGYFLETWNQKRYADAGLPSTFVQDNLSFSCRGTLRGLHFQNPNAQGKLVSVIEGEVYDVAVDLRQSSSTFSRWYAVQLSGKNRLQLYIPPGFAHGFAVLSETALFHYKCTDFYEPRHEATLRWNDPALGILWPVENPIVSQKDQNGVPLREFSSERLFA